jgi:hypothetical protein
MREVGFAHIKEKACLSGKCYALPLNPLSRHTQLHDVLILVKVAGEVKIYLHRVSPYYLGLS